MRASPTTPRRALTNAPPFMRLSKNITSAHSIYLRNKGGKSCLRKRPARAACWGRFLCELEGRARSVRSQVCPRRAMARNVSSSATLVPKLPTTRAVAR